MTWCLILLLIGVFCILRTDWFIAAFPVLTAMYGAFMFLAGVSLIVEAVLDIITIFLTYIGMKKNNERVRGYFGLKNTYVKRG